MKKERLSKLLAVLLLVLLVFWILWDQGIWADLTRKPSGFLYADLAERPGELLVARIGDEPLYLPAEELLGLEVWERYLLIDALLEERLLSDAAIAQGLASGDALKEQLYKDWQKEAPRYDFDFYLSLYLGEQTRERRAWCVYYPEDSAEACFWREILPLPEEKLECSIVPDVLAYDAAQITVTLENKIDSAWIYGEAFELYYRHNDQWLLVIEQENLAFFISIGYALEPFATAQKDYPISVYADRLHPGEYMFVSSVGLEVPNPQGQGLPNYGLVAYFTVE